MTWSRYWEFLAFVIVLVLIPGPDFALVAKNTLAGGRSRGRWAASGVSLGSAVQGAAAASGLSALIVRAQPVFQGIKWAGVVYLALLGAQAVRSALRGLYPAGDASGEIQDATSTPRRAAACWQGLACNLTNPKVLVFYVAVLPQFLGPGVGLEWSLLLAWSVPAIGLVYLLVLVNGMHYARATLTRRRVRRALDGATGAVLLGFAAALAADSS